MQFNSRLNAKLIIHQSLTPSSCFSFQKFKSLAPDLDPRPTSVLPISATIFTSQPNDWNSTTSSNYEAARHPSLSDIPIHFLRFNLKIRSKTDQPGNGATSTKPSTSMAGGLPKFIIATSTTTSLIDVCVSQTGRGLGAPTLTSY